MGPTTAVRRGGAPPTAMSVLNWLLIHVGDAAQWLWAGLKTVLGSAGLWLDRLLNPLLSPLLAALNRVATPIGDALATALSWLPPGVGLVLSSALVGVLMLLAFRYTSNQTALGRARDDIAANLLALKLFKDDLRVGLMAQLRLLAALARLQYHMLRPVLIMLLPILLILGQMGLCYQWRPLRPGERTLIRVRLGQQAANDGQLEVNLLPTRGLLVEAGPVPGGGQLVWRVRGGEPGRYRLQFELRRLPASADDGGTGLIVEKELVVGHERGRVSAARVGAQWTTQILHPAEARLPEDGPLRSIEIEYAGADSYFSGSNWWLLWFFAISMAAALLLKPVFRVRF